MADHTAVLTITYRDDQMPAASVLALDKRLYLAQAANHLVAMGAGSVTGTLDVQVDGGDAVAASGTVTLDTASGTVGATINGVSITVTYATSDANTASLLAAAINASANALVSGIVTAAAEDEVVTITAVVKGKVGNAITLAASGTGATASGARLTGGTNATANTVTV